MSETPTAQAQARRPRRPPPPGTREPAPSTSPTSWWSRRSPTRRPTRAPTGCASQDEAKAASFSFRAGQFGEYSVFGAGESTFCIASPPTRTGYIECTFKAAGKVTGSLREVDVGDMLGFRGPYGNVFPVEEWEGRNLVFIAGGIGLAPVRCVIWNVLDLRDGTAT